MRFKASCKGPAIKEKGTFFGTFFIFFIFFLPFKDKNYLSLDNLSKYGHIMLKFVVIWVVTFSKNEAVLVQVLGAKKNCQNPFPAILRIKKRKNSWLLREELFLRLPLLTWEACKKIVVFGFYGD